MTNRKEVRNGDAKFDIINVNGDDVADSFADGFAQILFGPNVCKISFYTNLGIEDDGVEQRLVTQRLTLPTLSLIELANSILKSVSENKDFLLKEIDKSNDALKLRIQENK